jgi:hypothetical protein
MPAELERRVRAAATVDPVAHELPPGVGHEVFPRGSPMWAMRDAWREDESDVCRQLDAEWKARDPLYWRLDDPVAERRMRAFISEYIQSHDTRGDPPGREVKVDKRVPLLKRVFSTDATWVTLHEFERCLRRDAVAWEQREAEALQEEIRKAARAVAAARRDLERCEHRFRWLTDEEYRNALEEEDEADRQEERWRWLDETKHERDSWARLLAEDTARRNAETEAEAGADPAPDDDED